MWTLTALALLFSLAESNCLEDGRSENVLITGFVGNLLRNFDSTDSSIKDVGIFRVNFFLRSSRKIDDLREDIHALIPKSMAVHSSPVDRIVENRNLKVSSLIVIISDVANEVSCCGSLIELY